MMLTRHTAHYKFVISCSSCFKSLVGSAIVIRTEREQWSCKVVLENKSIWPFTHTMRIHAGSSTPHQEETLAICLCLWSKAPYQASRHVIRILLCTDAPVSLPLRCKKWWLWCTVMLQRILKLAWLMTLLHLGCCEVCQERKASVFIKPPLAACMKLGAVCVDQGMFILYDRKYRPDVDRLDLPKFDVSEIYYNWP